MGLPKRVGEVLFFVLRTVVQPLTWPGYSVMYVGLFLTRGLDEHRRKDALMPFCGVACRLWRLERVVWRPVYRALVWSCPALFDEPEGVQ